MSTLSTPFITGSPHNQQRSQTTSDHYVASVLKPLYIYNTPSIPIIPRIIINQPSLILITWLLLHIIGVNISIQKSCLRINCYKVFKILKTLEVWAKQECPSSSTLWRVPQIEKLGAQGVFFRKIAVKPLKICRLVSLGAKSHRES